MTKHTFTPGPWSLERDGFTLCMGGQIVATAIAPDGATVQEQRANARLLAAAPDMLAALRAIVKITDGSQPIDYPGALMVARAALAKVAA